MSERAPRRRTIWDAAILVLGLNVWTSLLLVPALHLERRPGPVTIALMSLSLLTLLVGLVSRQRLLLLAAFPATLLLPVVATPTLVGVNVFSRWTFVLVSVGFIAYTIVSALLLEVLEAPAAPERRKRLPPGATGERWAKRWRIYIAMAFFSAAIPALLIFTLFLDRHVAADLARFYPERGPAAAVLFGVIAVGLWLGLFAAYFIAPLRAHVRGDPTTRSNLMRLRRESGGQRPRLRFYAWVGVALLLVSYLLFLR
ncbi:MAG: hypothetical protein KC503_36050 [Myxococcales bacterium]|nr:hypothetical protein [Myxococcales bacterium]